MLVAINVITIYVLYFSTALLNLFNVQKYIHISYMLVSIDVITMHFKLLQRLYQSYMPCPKTYSYFPE